MRDIPKIQERSRHERFFSLIANLSLTNDPEAFFLQILLVLVFNFTSKLNSLYHWCFISWMMYTDACFQTGFYGSRPSWEPGKAVNIFGSEISKCDKSWGGGSSPCLITSYVTLSLYLEMYYEAGELPIERKKDDDSN